MEELSVKDVVEFGMSGLAIVGLWQLWNRLTVLTDRLFIYLEEGKRERHELRNEVQVLKTGQEQIKRGMGNGQSNN